MYSVITLLITLAHTESRKWRFRCKEVLFVWNRDLNRGIKNPRLTLAESSSCRLHDELQHEKLMCLNCKLCELFTSRKAHSSTYRDHPNPITLSCETQSSLVILYTFKPYSHDTTPSSKMTDKTTQEKAKKSAIMYAKDWGGMLPIPLPRTFYRSPTSLSRKTLLYNLVCHELN